MKLNLIFLILLTFIGIQPLLGQTKNEKEERIRYNDLPELSKTVLDGLPKACKRLKLYKETDGNKRSYEAKFRFEKKRYSLEFSEDGNIEDIELLIKFKSIETLITQNIEGYFKKTYQKYRFIKIQKQFVLKAKNDSLTSVLNILVGNSAANSNFEIIAEVKSNHGRDIKEFVFNDKGGFLSVRILEPTSYEHALY